MWEPLPLSLADLDTSILATKKPPIPAYSLLNLYFAFLFQLALSATLVPPANHGVLRIQLALAFFLLCDAGRTFRPPPRAKLAHSPFAGFWFALNGVYGNFLAAITFLAQCLGKNKPWRAPNKEENHPPSIFESRTRTHLRARRGRAERRLVAFLPVQLEYYLFSARAQLRFSHLSTWRLRKVSLPPPPTHTHR